MVKLDNINRKILSILQENSSITNSDLSKEIRLAPATTLERVKKLELSGIIKGYVALVDQKKIGKAITAFVEISMKNHSASSIKNFSSDIAALPEVLECHHLAGDKDFLLKVITEDIESYRIFALDKLASIPGIGNVCTFFTLDTIKYSTGIPLD
ncbi:MAG: Lrp/AsnC family transcriptional regulator [Spirochaetia bacterium]|jgi:Lrp/AsnC family leucine-responsive transcriptional regulator|nr:Lrp/AsnC family transcriptional regulator [Spirochaetia bacterium]